MANKVVSNTGPLIHLSEIELFEALEVFDNIYIPEEVQNELIKSKIKEIRKIKFNFPLRMGSEAPWGIVP